MRSDKLFEDNVLDLSNDGNMSPKYARIFNKTADDIRKEYTDLVNDLSQNNKHILNWFVTPFACRNTYVCSVFEDVVRLVFIKTMVAREHQINVIIVDNPLVVEIIRDYIPGSVRVESKQGKLKYYASLISKLMLGACKYIFSSLLRYISFKLAVLITKKKSSVEYKKNVVVETYLYKNSFEKEEFNDRHFQGMNSYLDEEKLNKILFIPMFYRVYNCFPLYLKALKSKTSFLFVEEHISLLDIFYPLLHPFLLRNSPKDIYIHDIDISKLVSQSLFQHSTYTSSLYAILKYRFCCKLKKIDTISIEHVLRWYENQEIDHGSIMGWRAYSESINIVGYMGFFASKNYLCAYPIPEENNLRITPDCIGVMGAGLVEEHKKFCNSLNMKVAPSFRFSLPKLLARTRGNNIKGVRILVALPISQQHIRTIIKIISAVPIINSNSLTSIQFIIKPHPASAFTGGELPVDTNNVQYSVDHDSITNLFKGVDYVMSAASSTIVEAIMHGIPVLLASSTQSLRENVIPEFIAEDLWDEVYNAEELYYSITKRRQISRLNDDELNLLNLEIVGQQPNSQNVANLLGGFT